MGINSQTEISADLQIGPTSQGMVRLYISGTNVDLPMDFTAQEAREIAAELTAAADIVSATTKNAGPKPKRRQPARK
ncbi:MAG: DUF6324 family protein [Alphaproteobacteria bacterium]